MAAMFIQITGRGTRKLQTPKPINTMFIQTTGRATRNWKIPKQSSTGYRKPINTLCPSCKGECLDYTMYVCPTCNNKGYIFHPENFFGDSVCPSCKGACLNAKLF